MSVFWYRMVQGLFLRTHWFCNGTNIALTIEVFAVSYL